MSSQFPTPIAIDNRAALRDCERFSEGEVSSFSERRQFVGWNRQMMPNIGRMRVEFGYATG